MTSHSDARASRLPTSPSTVTTEKTTGTTTRTVALLCSQPHGPTQPGRPSVAGETAYTVALLCSQAHGPTQPGRPSVAMKGETARTVASNDEASTSSGACVVRTSTSLCAAVGVAQSSMLSLNRPPAPNTTRLVGYQLSQIDPRDALPHARRAADRPTTRYDTMSRFNVRSRADINLLHKTKNKRKGKAKKEGICSEAAVNSPGSPWSQSWSRGGRRV